jgi:hypothetical protein
MKKVMTIICIVVQSLIIGVANLFAIAIVMNWFADTIGYYGFWNIPVFFVVAAIVCATLAVYVNSIANQKL